MPKVPYQPYSEVAPSGAGVNIATTPEAFGVGIGRATEGLGGVVEQAGDTVFRRAMAIQQLNNETEAEQGNLRLMDEVGELHAKFNALQGEERVKAYPQYRKDLLAAHARVSASLSNDMARRMYDRAALTTIGRTIFNGAGAAASAQREWYGNTANAVMDMAVKTASDDPLNNPLWEEQKAIITKAGYDVAYSKHGVGPDSPIAKDIVMKGISAAARERIVSVAHVDPWRAGEMEEQAVANKELTGPDKQHIDNIIRTERRSIGGANIANKVYELGKETEDKPGKSAKQMEEEVRTEAGRVFGNDVIAVEHAVTALQTRIAKDDRIDKIEKANNTQTIWEAIEAYQPSDIQELRAVDPKVMNAIDALPAKVREKLADDIKARATRKESELSNWNYKRLLTMADEDPMKFLELHLPDEKHLTTGQFKSLLALRNQKIKNPGDEPRTARAMGWLLDAYGDTMKRLGIDSSRGDNPAYYEFRGSLLQGIEALQSEKKRPVTQKDVVEDMWPILTKNLTFPGRFFGTNEYPLWKPPTYGKSGYENFANKVRRDAAALGTEVTDEQIKNKWKRMLILKVIKGQDGK